MHEMFSFFISNFFISNFFYVKWKFKKFRKKLENRMNSPFPKKAWRWTAMINSKRENSVKYVNSIYFGSIMIGTWYRTSFDGDCTWIKATEAIDMDKLCFDLTWVTGNWREQSVRSLLTRCTIIAIHHLFTKII